MAVLPLPWPSIQPVAGVRLATAEAGIKRRGGADLTLFAFDAGSVVSALFTRNAFRAAPVLLAETHLALAPPRYLLINSGNANAGTGPGGMAAARRCCELLAAETGCRPEEVLPFSTGVIGEPLPVARFETALPRLVTALAADGWEAAARAIMTTDTLPKGSQREFMQGDKVVRVAGIAKGAGMIRPDMATMLAFLATDLEVSRPLLDTVLRQAVDASFNRITIDGDTSTNDACVLAATGRSGATALTDLDSPLGRQFIDAVTEVCRELAQAIVRDGEGATKFITIEVEQARSEAEALQVAYTVAHSPLVKTAFFASDPNWGRILAAVGRAGVEGLDVGLINIDLDEVRIVSAGGRDPDYREERGQAVMDRAEIRVRIELGRGRVAQQIWTTDLSHDYVRINAEYRT
ncbi:MAG TPA: bifunctional glutamate N-acetyltransferase/amino-acid acetyltransferase ArgJ [Pseudomonadales bacterium]|jgi:glutamate N-acetyltransferase/amino-acid N-acetyltransferase|nr:bifunctional glutamate N-acetyltransferase/amino-acid acetyltransferase ArgJ [Pseudomonadales bacterium]HMU90370.1 bifunctional glutamate N-acetyltransferase/amino-acid acetyltransferase ArgJ [Pseudomonadales bacterium]HMW15004.1 bifunctional glutamate N-acetyltransferase/amino-acid acetyltransferase ArgJ [Pseudomonadales bacterium]HMY96965.1 bifunctional glutamate N-acetyltransferase/amino-acid acetyltransferase ArgJ [Pseudomonadales bacterium]HMZ71027.1 bifunctional glutamate N-acetyltrans